MNILFVLPRIPYPLDMGGKIRTFNLIKQALSAGNKIIALSFIYTESDRKSACEMEKMGIRVIGIDSVDKIGLLTVIKSLFTNLPLTVAKYQKHSMAKAIRELINQNNIDIVHFDHIHLGQYSNICNGVPFIIDEHNIESLIIKRLSENENNFLKKIIFENQFVKMQNLEKNKCKQANRVFTVSNEDKARLEIIVGGKLKTEVIPNGVDIEHFTADSALAEEDTVSFVGALDWLPNELAVRYFIKEILPLIWQEKPQTKFYVIGKKASSKIQQFAKDDPRVIFTGSTEDTRPYVVKSKVFVVPIQIGGGTRIKILEAMALKKAIVSTSVGAEGLNATDGKHLIIADKPEDFAKQVLLLLNNASFRAQIGEEARQFVEERYEWRIIGEKLNKVYQEIINNRNDE